MIRRLHPIAGMLALATIAAFWTATVLAEALGDGATIALVKRAILWGVLGLVPMIMLAGITGLRMGRGGRDPRIAAKGRRMPIIAANGVLVLVPSAVALDAMASAGDFGTTFLVVQGVELVAGAVNATLLALNARDGARLARQRGGTVPREA